MQRRTRNLSLVVCDYNNNVLCNLYDNTSDASGQASDVFVTTERNGWKELNFRIPSTCTGIDGEEENFRLQFLKADFKIRLVDDFETDWYLISEPKITHNNFSKMVEVRCGHIAQLLKYKALDLEFSDEEGNNVGTASMLLSTILEGTGWNVGNVAEFKEDDKITTKVRSLVASAKTGAFKLIEDMCELFDAKPIYHGDTRTVDIVPMNPFSKEVLPGEIPEEVLNEELRVQEIHYDKALKNITRTINAENIVTRLYAYGAYGSLETGFLSMQTCSHEEFVLSAGNYPVGTEFGFEDSYNAKFYFKNTEAITSSTKLVYNKLDFLSRMYVWNDSTKKAYRVYSKPENASSVVTLSTTRNVVKNVFPYLMSFTYYDKVGLLTDGMLQMLARYQQEMPSLYDQSVQASTDLNANLSKLSELFESPTGFLKLSVGSYDQDTDRDLIMRFNINHGDHGVIYRSDYDSAKRNYFSWYVAKALKPNGQVEHPPASIVYIIHNTNPVTWETAYVKTIRNDQDVIYADADGTPGAFNYGLDEGEPAAISLHIQRDSVPALSSNDSIFLFCTPSTYGMLGAKLDTVKSNETSLQTITKNGTQSNPVYFVKNTDPAPSLTNVLSSYGWYYKHFPNTNAMGQLYFCYGSRGDQEWKTVYTQNTAPAVVNGDYYYNTKEKHVYHGESGKWVQYKDTNADTDLAAKFSSVLLLCQEREVNLKGVYEKYRYTGNNALVPDNYAFVNEYGYLYLCTTTLNVAKNGLYIQTTSPARIFQDNTQENTIGYAQVRNERVAYPKANEFVDIATTPGSIVNGVDTNSNDFTRTQYFSGRSNMSYSYDLPADSTIHEYDGAKNFLKQSNVGGTGVLTTNGKTEYIRISYKTAAFRTNHYFRVTKYNTILYYDNEVYNIITAITGEGQLNGVYPLLKSFPTLTDTIYIDNLNDYKSAQNEIKERDNELTVTLGDLLREGFWQENNYVEGDEDKLYKDAMDNLKEICEPEIIYDISYLDLYDSNKDMGYSIDPEAQYVIGNTIVNDVEWPDTQITDAVHLVDTDIDVNCWAYIDKIRKCYDQPWKTELQINTKLSLIDQHSFTDVMARIAEVASETKANQTIYSRSEYIGSTGRIAVDLLDGMINTNKTLIMGGASNWYTDEAGHMIFESTDGTSAMMLGGYGLMIANSRDKYGDWEWRNSMTGQGIAADVIAAGFISARELLAGSITTDMIHAGVGQTLEIGSNKALMLYATIDGFKPAGGVLTPHANPGDSYIEIAAAQNGNPAYINVATAGRLNILAGSEESVDGEINIESTGKLNIKSGGDMSVDSGGKLDIKSGSTLTISSPNFKIKDNGNVEIEGKVTATSGKIANFEIATSGNTGYIRNGTQDINSTAAGIYMGTDGLNIGGKFVYKVSDQSTSLKISASSLTLIGSNPDTTLQSELDNEVIESVRVYKINNIASGGTKPTPDNTWTINIPAITSSNKHLWSATRTTKRDKTVSYTEVTYEGNLSNLSGIPLGLVAVPKVQSTGITIDGNNMTVGATGKMTVAANGELKIANSDGNNMIAMDKNGISITNNAKLSIASGKEMNIVSGGVIKIGQQNSQNQGSLFTIGSTEGGNAYIYCKRNSISQKDITGIYLGTDGINVGKANSHHLIVNPSAAGTPADPVVDIEGNIKATSGSFTGTISSQDGNIGGWKINSSSLTGNKTGLAKTTNDTDIAIWAGNATASSAAFKVRQSGAVEASNISITGGSITLKNGNTTYFSASASGASINGKIQAKSGDIGGFTIFNEGLYTGEKTGIVTSKQGIYIGTGGIGLGANNEFWVTEEGRMSATRGTIAGWNLSDTQLTGTYLGLESKRTDDATTAIWVGNTGGPKLTSPFRVTMDGSAYITKGIIAGWTMSGTQLTGSHIGLESKRTDDATTAIWVGTASPTTTTPFRVTMNGNMYATKGKIGGWFVGGDSINTNASGLLSSGSGDNYVGIDGGTSGYTHALWVGAEGYSNAPFSVKRDGTVTITKLLVYDPDTGASKSINLYQDFTSARNVAVTSWSHSATPTGYPPSYVHVTVVANLSNGRRNSTSFDIPL